MIKEQKNFTPKLVSKEKDKDMHEGLFRDVEAYAKEAFDNKFTDEKEIADYIKKKLEERNERDVCWHVVVGRHFGGYVTYTEKMYAYFYIGQMGFLIFATIKNFSITQQQSSVITNQLKQKLNTARKSHRQFISLKTNYADDFIGLTNLIGNNFNLKNTSQVYNTQEKYLGYLELESSLNENVLKSQLESFVEQYGIDMESASFDIINEIPDRNLLRDKKRFSLFNKKGISSIVSANLYYRWIPGDGGQLFGDELERNQDYGVILDRLEENKDHFDIIEIQGESDMGEVVPHFDEFMRIKHFMERIRDRKILKDKLISVKTKKVNVAIKSIQEGADILNDSTNGNVDPILLDVISKSKVYYILSTMAGQENLSKFSLDNNYSKHTPFEYYLNTLERRLNLCIEKGIPTWNIAIDLNMNRFGKKLSIDIYDKLNLIKNKFDNTLLSSFNIEPVFKSIVGERNNQNDSAALEANKQIIDYLAQNGINVIRFDNWNNFEKISEHIKNVKNVGEVLHTRIKERTSEKEDEEVIIQEEEKVKVEEIESEKEKYDDLTILIKKLEAGKI